jgi:hypothetical protein
MTINIALLAMGIISATFGQNTPDLRSVRPYLGAEQYRDCAVIIGVSSETPEL